MTIYSLEVLLSQLEQVHCSMSGSNGCFLTCIQFFQQAGKVKSFSRVQLFATSWTVAHQALPSMEFSRQEYWSGLPFPSPEDLPDPGIESRSPSLQADASPSEPLGKPMGSLLVPCPQNRDTCPRTEMSSCIPCRLTLAPEATHLAWACLLHPLQALACLGSVSATPALVLSPSPPEWKS